MTDDASTHPASVRAVTELSVAGMTCQNCARHVTEAIQSVPGVAGASVALAAGRALVRWGENQSANVPAVLAAITKAGYVAQPLDAAKAAAAGKPNWHGNLWLGGVVTATLMAGEWIFDLGGHRGFQSFAFLAAGVVQVFAGASFYRSAWRQLKVGSSNMDTLVALGSSTAFTYSAWAYFSQPGRHLYFMEAAAIITLISIGHWIEARVSARASSALHALLNLAPVTARRLGPAPGAAPRTFDVRNARFTAAPPALPVETQVNVSELRAEDLVVLRPGDRVPVDGVVVQGESAVDEAMLTGEARPVNKAAGKELYTGTVNLDGRLIMRVTATGDATALAQVIAAVERAQTSRANIQRLGDRVSNVFVPVVVTVAVLAGLMWGLAPDLTQHLHGALAGFLWPAHPPTGAAAGFIIAAAVLIIACPCAMGLAAPAAIMASANAAAARGILIRDGVALEKAGTVTAVIFDKTGTLTRGKFEVAGFLNLAQSNRPLGTDEVPPERRVRAIAAALTRSSAHPISQAIAAQDPEEISFTDWQELRGSGLSARFHDVSAVQSARLGAMRWLAQSGVDISPAREFVDEWSARGATTVGFALDTKLVGLFAVRDALKPGAASVVAQLQRQGLKIYLVTGDIAATALGLARETGIPEGNVFAEVRPEAKAEFVKKLQANGERVAFVGDGINDAPALTQADLGIAVSRASDIAREAADLILLKSEIEAVPEALGLARATLRAIKQNLFWAFFYNCVGVPLAALGFMSPVLCAAAMGFSDLIVIGNALRLRRWRLK